MATGIPPAAARISHRCWFGEVSQQRDRQSSGDQTWGHKPRHRYGELPVVRTVPSRKSTSHNLALAGKIPPGRVVRRAERTLGGLNTIAVDSLRIGGDF